MPHKTKIHTPRSPNAERTPQTIATELGLPVETVLKHLAALNLDGLTAESPIEESDYPPLLRAVRKRHKESKGDPDGIQEAHANEVFKRHGARLMGSHPWIVGAGVNYSKKHHQFVIQVSTNRPAKRLRGVPEKIVGIPVVLLYTGSITRADA